MSRLIRQIEGATDTTKAISREDLLLNEFINLAINRFTWENLPLGLTSERLEEMLLSYGTLGAFRNEVGSVTILPIYSNNKLNIYGEYDSFRVKGFNGYEREVKEEELIKLKNNPLGTEDLSTLQIYAKRIDDIERTEDVNLFQQRIPKILMTNADSVLTAKNLIKKITDFNFAIFTKDKGTKASLKADEVLDTTAPYILDKLSDYETFNRNKVLTFLGINNSSIDKKERLITDEVNSNNEHIGINLDLMFDMRKSFTELINAKFGTEIKVEKREVEVNGSIHNDTIRSDRIDRSI